MAHQFKAGDRVRLKADQFDYAVTNNIQGEQIITSIQPDGLVYFRGGSSAYAFRLEPAPAAPALIDPAKKYRTRDGRDVRIYATDGGGEYPVHGAIKGDDDEWYPVRWCATGNSYVDSEEWHDDLIEVKPEREYWLNIYSADIPASLYLTKQDADAAAASDRIACIHLKFTEGEGLA